MDELKDAGTEAARQALAAERLRSARVLGLLRFVGISIARALNLLLPEVLHETRALQADTRLFACYWLAAAAVFWANHGCLQGMTGPARRVRTRDGTEHVLGPLADYQALLDADHAAPFAPELVRAIVERLRAQLKADEPTVDVDEVLAAYDAAYDQG